MVLAANSSPSLAIGPNASDRQKYDLAKVEYIDNGTIKLGVSLDLGGAITYIAKSKGGKNIINNYDWGRQIQMSFFADPAPLYRERAEAKEALGTYRLEPDSGR